MPARHLGGLVICAMICVMVDALFDDRRLAGISDLLDADRSDLDAYVALADELGARTVVDLGCGTGTLACLLARRGIGVVGVDPAESSLDVARRKPFADRVQWVLGDATSLPPIRVDLLTMTGNVAQVFLTDESWTTTLAGARAVLGPNGLLVFEVRDPAREGWREWTRDRSLRHLELPGVGTVETWVDLTDVSLPFVSFRWTFVFGADGSVLTSDSTLRFRDRAEIDDSLRAAGLAVVDIRDASDRPGKELVFIARPVADGRPFGSPELITP